MPSFRQFVPSTVTAPATLDSLYDTWSGLRNGNRNLGDEPRTEARRERRIVGMKWLIYLLENHGDIQGQYTTSRDAPIAPAVIALRLRWLLRLPTTGYEGFPTPAEAVEAYLAARGERAPGQMDTLVRPYIWHQQMSPTSEFYNFDTDFDWRVANNVLNDVESRCLMSQYRAVDGSRCYDNKPDLHGVAASTIVHRLRGFAFPTWQEREAIRVAIANAIEPLSWANETPATPGREAQAATDTRPARKAVADKPSIPALEPITGHYAFVSGAHPGMICFTADDAKGERETHTIMKPGRYLKANYPHLDASQIERIQARFDLTMTVRFATTPAEIVDVYRNGPDSCMSHNIDSYHTNGVHPVSVYGEPGDLTLAYLVDVNGKPTARALVWTARKIFGRSYGLISALDSRLVALGYSRKTLQGAKVARVPVTGRNGSNRLNANKDRFVMPYIDDTQYVDDSDCGKYFVLSDRGYSASMTDGVLLLQRCTCATCGDDVDEDDTYTSPDGENHCASCYNENWTECDRTGQTVDLESVSEVITYRRRDGRTDTSYWGEASVSDYATRCEFDDNYYSDNAFTFVEVITHATCSMTETWELRNAIDNATHHEASGTWYAKAGLAQLPDDNDDDEASLTREAA